MSRQFPVDQSFGIVRWPVGVDGHWTRWPYTCSRKGAAPLILAFTSASRLTRSAADSPHQSTTPAGVQFPGHTGGALGRRSTWVAGFGGATKLGLPRCGGWLGAGRLPICDHARRHRDRSEQRKRQLGGARRNVFIKKTANPPFTLSADRQRRCAGGANAEADGALGRQRAGREGSGGRRQPGASAVCFCGLRERSRIPSTRFLPDSCLLRGAVWRIESSYFHAFIKILAHFVLDFASLFQ